MKMDKSWLVVGWGNSALGSAWEVLNDRNMEWLDIDMVVIGKLEGKFRRCLKVDS